MSYIIDFLKSIGMNILESSSQIVFSHFIKTELPEFLVFWIQTDMLSTIIIASHIAQPYIEPFVGKIESRSKVLIRSWINNPSITTVYESMLQVDDRQIGNELSLSLFLDSVVGQDVAIFCLYFVFLDWIVV